MPHYFFFRSDFLSPLPADSAPAPGGSPPLSSGDRWLRNLFGFSTPPLPFYRSLLLFIRAEPASFPVFSSFGPATEIHWTFFFSLADNAPHSIGFPAVSFALAFCVLFLMGRFCFFFLWLASRRAPFTSFFLPDPFEQFLTLCRSLFSRDPCRPSRFFYPSLGQVSLLLLSVLSNL